MKPLALRVLTALLALALAAPAGAMAASGVLSTSAGSSWQADGTFAIQWDPIPPANPTKALYRLYDSQGQLRLSFSTSPTRTLEAIDVPDVPDTYTLEAWLVNASGETGPRSTATLRFDNAAPSVPRLDSAPDWISSLQTATAQVAAEDPLPLSGIGGFAVSVDRGSGSSPCAQPGRCLAAEIDLAEGDGGTIPLGTLPEGLHFVRAVAVSGTGVPSLVATVAVRVDGSAPALSLEGNPAGWSRQPVLVTARAVDSLSGMTATGPLGPFTAVAVDGAAPARALGHTIGAWVDGSGTHLVESFARDAAGNVSDSKSVRVRIDENPPRVAFAAAQDPGEPERIEATVSDSLSGPSPDRGSIGVRRSGTRTPFEPLLTRNVSDRLVAQWDSDSYPPGKYEFLATAYDTAGNSGVGANRARGGRMVLLNPLKAQLALTTGLARRRLAGHLRRVGGSPVTGREVVVTETFAGGAHPRQRTTVVGTDREGGFSLLLGPGPSRDVVARFAGTALLSRAASSTTHLDAATRIRLRSSATAAKVGGKPVVFSGKVALRGVEASAANGLPVELQFRFRGGAWSEFRTVEADARGRFRYRYRFSDDDSRGIRFQFRAYVKGRKGWPYGPGTSRPVQVTGR